MMKQMMKQFDLNWMRLLAGACGLFTILALTPVGVAQQGAAVQGGNVSAAATATAAPVAKTGLAANPAAKPAEEQEASASGKPASEGIKVHGHWVLQVKNADGTLGERREFDNSLVTDDNQVSGDQVLVGLLSGNISPGDPAVAFIQPPLPANISTSCAAVYLNVSGLVFTPGSTCYGLTTSASGMTADTNFVTGLSTTTYFTSPVKWVLSGNYTVPSGLVTISVVQTLLSTCTNKSVTFLGPGNNPNSFLGTSPDRTADIGSNACIPAGSSTSSTPSDYVYFATLTSTTITSGGVATPLTVTTGQLITVTVTISFS